MKKIDKHYVSEIDKKLAEFDQTHGKSASQMAEIAKYRAVFEKRDKAVIDSEESSELWA